MSLKEFGLIVAFCTVCVFGVIWVAYVFGEATRNEARTQNCVKVCAPYLHEIIRDECYCADAEGRYVKRTLPARPEHAP